jgi:glycolate oxidase subunit GlcD
MLTDDDLSFFREIVGDDDISVDEVDLYVYSFDTTPVEGKAHVILRPETTEEVSEILKYANKHKIPVTPRGAGSGTAGGCVPLKGGIILDLTKMDKIIEIDIPNRVVVTQPGVVHNKLNQEIGKYGFYFPPNPGSNKVCTIGAQVAIGGSGSRAVRSGVTRNYVLGLKVVLPNGSVITTGGKFHKNTSGIDLTHLFIGSEGTLGVITEIILKIIPKPEKVAVVSAPFNDVRDAQRAVERIFASRIVPNAIEFLDRDMIAGINAFKPNLNLPSADVILFFEVEGSAEEARRQAEIVAKICEEEGAFNVRWSDDEKESKEIWEGRSAAGGSVGRLNPKHSRVYLGAEDVIVPPAKVGEMILGIREISKRVGIEIYTYGHFGEGNIHPGMVIDQSSEEDWKKLEIAVKEIYELALKLGGTLSGEHGMGCTRNEYMERIHGKEAFELMKGIKRLFDPNNIMNPGKLGFEF